MKSYQWCWWELLLWGYSSLLIGYIVVVSGLQSAGLMAPLPPSNNDATYALLSFIIFAPVLLFLAIEGVKHIRDTE